MTPREKYEKIFHKPIDKFITIKVIKEIYQHLFGDGTIEKNPFETLFKLKYSDYEKFELCSLRVGIRAAADNPLCSKTLRLSQLRNQNFVCMDEASNLNKMLLNACNKAGFSPNIILKTNDSQCYAKCIENGMGLAPSRYYANESDVHAKTKILNISDFNERQTIYVYYKKHIEHENVGKFVRFLKSKQY